MRFTARVIAGISGVTALAIALSASVPAHAQVAEARGKILKIRIVPSGRVVIQRADGRNEPAGAGVFLYPGDWVITVGGWVRFQVGGILQELPDQTRTLQDRYMIPKRAGLVGKVRDWIEHNFEGWSALLASDPAPPPVHAKVREGGERPRLVEDPLLPKSQQRMPAGSDHAAFIWRGGAAILLVEGTSATEHDSGSFAFVTAPLPSSTKVTVKLRDSDLAWDVRIGGEPPLPPELKASGQPLTNEERAARAFWILKEEHDEWRLFAITELHDLSLEDDFLGASLWASIISDAHPLVLK